MKTILRSLVWADPAEKTTATENMRVLEKERFVELNKQEQSLLDDVASFFVNGGEAPALDYLVKQAEAANAVERIDLLSELIAQRPLTGVSFKQHAEGVIEGQAADRLVGVLKTAAKIATQGEKVGQQVLKGTDAAVGFLMTSAQEKPKEAAARVPNDQGAATQALKLVYQSRKANPTLAYGVMSGYGVIDASTGGVKKKQLWIHAGFTGHLKSTTMLNFVLNAAVDGGWNPLVFSSEMPQEEIQFILIGMHSANPKFTTTHPPLNVTRILRGEMSAKEEAFYDLVQDDLTRNKAHGVIRVIDTAEFSTFGSVMQRTLREHSKVEVDVLWVDYITRLPVDVKSRHMTVTEAKNEAIVDAKRFAMAFDNGRGLAVCTPFQTNREGYKRARDNEGRMDLTMLAQFNAAEKEADVVTGVFYGEAEQATNEPKLTVMKSRWGKAGLNPVPLFADPDSRRISDLSAGMSFVSTQPGAAGTAVEL